MNGPEKGFLEEYKDNISATPYKNSNVTQDRRKSQFYKQVEKRFSHLAPEQTMTPQSAL